MMAGKNLLALAAAASAALCCTAEITVSDVTIAQNPLTRLVTVDYTLGGEPAIVTVDFLTNGVSIGEQNFRNVYGDVNRLVSTNGTRRICWRPDLSWTGHSIADEIVTAKVSAWPTNDPPDYMVVALDTTTPLSPVSYYVSTNALPDGGLANDVYRTSRIVMRRIHAAGVRWLMGNDASGAAANETPHYVTLSDDYYIGIYEVTQEQYRRMTGASALGGAFTGYADSAVRPRSQLNYNTIRGSGLGNDHTVGSSSAIKKIRDLTDIDFDLPTDAQWEYACRAGTTGALYSGDPFSNANCQKLGWVYGNSAVDGTRQTHTAGTKPPNGWGLYDMIGNVREWCLDWYVADLGTEDVSDPMGPETGSNRVLRGGDYATSPSTTPSARMSYRQNDIPNRSASQASAFGFRLMCPIGLKFPAEEEAE